MQKQIGLLKPINTEKEYDNALAHVYELMQADIVEGSAISDELEILSLIIKEYELVHFPVSLFITHNVVEYVVSRKLHYLG